MEQYLKKGYIALKGGLLKLDGRSMEPVLRHGDLLRIDPVNVDNIKIGNIVLFCEQGKTKPVCHRVIGVYGKKGKRIFLEKGDNSCHIGLVKEEDILGGLSYVQDVDGARVIRQDYQANICLISVFSGIIIFHKRILGFIKKRFFPRGLNRLAGCLARVVWKGYSFIANSIVR